jgi:hypothetical protein
LENLDRSGHIGVVGGILMDVAKEDDSGECFDLDQNRIQLLCLYRGCNGLSGLLKVTQFLDLISNYDHFNRNGMFEIAS